MNAIEFVKKFGWGEAILNYHSCKHQYYFHYNGYIEVCVADLKQIVEAWELVEKVGGLDNAKTFDESCMYCIAHLTTLDNLQQAINLVEQCQ